MSGKAPGIEEALGKTQAVLKGHFKLSSGLHSDTYVQKLRLFQHPPVLEALAREMASQWAGAKPDIVAAPAVGAILLGYELARALGVRSVFLERKDGVFATRVGMEVAAGEKVLCAEDVVTTGGSVQEMAEVLSGLGAEVVGIAAVLDRSSSPLPFKKPFRALLRLNPAQYPPGECPLCKAGTPLDVPGSRQKARA